MTRIDELKANVGHVRGRPVLERLEVDGIPLTLVSNEATGSWALYGALPYLPRVRALLDAASVKKGDAPR